MVGQLMNATSSKHWKRNSNCKEEKINLISILLRSHSPWVESNSPGFSQLRSQVSERNVCLPYLWTTSLEEFWFFEKLVFKSIFRLSSDNWNRTPSCDFLWNFNDQTEIIKNNFFEVSIDKAREALISDNFSFFGDGRNLLEDLNS